MAANQIEGWMSEEELDWLYQTAREMGSVIEIGSWKGRSTYELLSGCAGEVYAVDHWLGSPSAREFYRETEISDVHSIFVANVGHFPNLRVIRKSSADAAEEAPSADMVFVDGDHEYEQVRNDLQLWTPKARKLICGHDYNWPGVRRAVHEAFGERDFAAAGTIWALQIQS
jgi:predicted O-methyltransferase YrrM